MVGNGRGAFPMTRKRAVIPLIVLLLVVSKSPVLAQQEKITAEEAKDHICEEITVCGAVVWFESDRTRGTTLYLDEPDGKQGFTVVISDYNLEKLVELLQNSKGKQICARGVITEYNGAPQIQIQELGQIEVELESRLSNEAKAVRALSTEVPQEEVALPDTIVLKRGTPIGLALRETLTSDETTITQEAFFEVFRDVRVRDLAVITRGAHAWGSVQMKKKANFGRPGSIRVELIAAHAITGDQVPLQASIAARGEQTLVTGPSGFDSIFAPVLGWFVKGSNPIIPKGTKLCAYVEEDVPFDTELLRKINARLESKPNETSPPI